MSRLLLGKDDIKTIEQLVAMTPSELHKCKNVGPKTVQKNIDRLAVFQLKLKDDDTFMYQHQGFLDKIEQRIGNIVEMYKKLEALETKLENHIKWAREEQQGTDDYIREQFENIDATLAGIKKTVAENKALTKEREALIHSKNRQLIWLCAIIFLGQVITACLLLHMYAYGPTG